MQQRIAQNYRDQLWDIYEKRLQRNSAYSLSAFARDLGIGNSTLSMVFQKKRGLSIANAEQIAKKLGFSERQTNSFLRSVKENSLRSKEGRQRIKKDDESIIEPRNIPVKQCAYEITWRHLALREFTSLDDFSPTGEWISKKIGNSIAEANRVLDECLQMGLIHKEDDGSYRASEHIVVGDKGANEGLRQQHRELLQKAITSINAPVNERSVSAVLLSVSENQFSEIVRLVRLFNSELSATIKKENSDKKDRVICLASQVFSV